MSDSDSFFEKVYSVAKQIPYGRVTSYGAIAKYLGAARSARMVGYAMNNSHTKNKTDFFKAFLNPKRVKRMIEEERKDTGNS